MGQIIYEDTRQKKGKHNHKNAWWKAHGVTVQRKKLDFGDYMVDGSNISVDSKANLQEICGNVGRDHARVVREVERANTAGFRLVFLVEVGGSYKAIPDVEGWTNDVCKRCSVYRANLCRPSRDRCKRYKRSPMSGKTLAKIMRSMERNHGCVFEFVKPTEAARRICNILGVKYDGQ